MNEKKEGETGKRDKGKCEKGGEEKRWKRKKKWVDEVEMKNGTEKGIKENRERKGKEERKEG